MKQGSLRREKLYDHNESTEAERVGRRIREIRIAQRLSRAELGERVGLNSNRIQQYENGTRKPRPELLTQIAVALGVEALALTDPVVANPTGAMYALFEMEKYYDLKVQRNDGILTLVFGNGRTGLMNICLDGWEKECRQIDSELETPVLDSKRADLIKVYNMWEWNFPQITPDRIEHDIRVLRRMQLEKYIGLLKEKLAELENDVEI